MQPIHPAANTPSSQYTQQPIHHLLTNSERTDLIGNIVWLDTANLLTPDKPWKPPQLGFAGRLYLGHQTDITDPCTIQIQINGQTVKANPIRHAWSPATQQTLYRIAYNSDEITLQEEKWIDDTAFCIRFQIHHSANRVLHVTFIPHGSFTSASLKVTATTQSLYQSLTTTVYTHCKPLSASVEPFTVTALSFVCGIGITKEEAKSAYALGLCSTPAAAREHFNMWFATHVPRFSCDDLLLQRLYYYRWFVVYRNLHQPDRWFPHHPMPGMLIYESPSGAWFSAPIGLPLSLQIRELRWMRDPLGVTDTIEAWIHNRGALRSYVSDPLSAALLFDMHHPKQVNMRRLLDEALALLDGKSPRSPRLVGGGINSFPITIGSWVTGTEFSPDFFARTEEMWNHTMNEDQLSSVGLPRAGEGDTPESSKLGHLYRVDTDTLHVMFVAATATLAARFAHPRRAELQQAAEQLSSQLAQLHCDSDGIFYSVDAQAGQRITNVINFDALMPFLIIPGTDQQHAGLLQVLDDYHLRAPFGLTTTSQQCPAFSPDNTWKIGPFASAEQPYHYPCCWNGPTWNFAMSWDLLALGHVAQRQQNRTMQEIFCQTWQRWNTAHYYQGDPSLPLVMEHYHPYTGKAFRVIPDYFHSAWLDVFFRCVVGLTDRDGSPCMQPMTQLGAYSIEDIPWHGSKLTIIAAPNEAGYHYQIVVAGTMTEQQATLV